MVGGTLFVLAGLAVGAFALTMITDYRGWAQQVTRWSQGNGWWSRSGIGAVQRWPAYRIAWGLLALAMAVVLVGAGIAELVAA